MKRSLSAALAGAALVGAGVLGPATTANASIFDGLIGGGSGLIGEGGLGGLFPPDNGPAWSTTEVSCDAANFRGTAEVKWRWRDDGSDWKAFDARMVRYKIDKLQGQSGGNKANINLGLDTYYNGNEHTGYGWLNSPDAMKQDGQWHSDTILGKSGHTSRLDGSAKASVEFIFDRSGTDPRCLAAVTKDAPR
jgi:hypothetical protein